MKIGTNWANPDRYDPHHSRQLIATGRKEKDEKRKEYKDSFLPVPGIPRPFGDITHAFLDARAHVGQAVADRSAGAPSEAVDCLAEAAGRSANYTTDCVGDARDGVAQDARDGLGCARDAFAVVVHGVGGGYLIYALFLIFLLLMEYGYGEMATRCIGEIYQTKHLQGNTGYISCPRRRVSRLG